MLPPFWLPGMLSWACLRAHRPQAVAILLASLASEAGAGTGGVVISRAMIANYTHQQPGLPGLRELTNGAPRRSAVQCALPSRPLQRCLDRTARRARA